MHFIKRTHAYMNKIARREKLMTNATYRKKYSPLTTPPPELIDIEPGQWDFWELWAGCGRLTSAVSKLGLKCGPPITKECGWDLSLPSHQKVLWALYIKHRPRVVYGAPVCGPWSQSSTTMQPDIKELLRSEQLECFTFFVKICREQDRTARKFLMENPRSSELLNQAICMILVLELHATDQYCCMCCHGLKDADNHKPCMKPTTLRGTIELRRTARWCQCTTPHQILQGCNRSGKLRTAEAQKYTLLFCKRLAADIFEALKPSSQKLKAFPASAEGE